jgi:hypothetical protein
MKLFHLLGLLLFQSLEMLRYFLGYSLTVFSLETSSRVVLQLCLCRCRVRRSRTLSQVRRNLVDTLSEASHEC